MKCSHCKQLFEECKIEESHDVPCYLFEGFNRNQKKNQADKFRRRWLCNDCHKEYERSLRRFLQFQALLFGNKHFGGDDDYS